MNEFRAFVASSRHVNRDAEPTSQHEQRRALLGGPSPATIRIQTEYQLSALTLTAAQQQAVKAVVTTAVGVINKFVKVHTIVHVHAPCMTHDS